MRDIKVIFPAVVQARSMVYKYMRGVGGGLVGLNFKKSFVFRKIRIWVTFYRKP